MYFIVQQYRREEGRDWRQRGIERRECGDIGENSEKLCLQLDERGNM